MADAAPFAEIQVMSDIRNSPVATRDFHGLTPLAVPQFYFASNGHRGLTRYDLCTLLYGVDCDVRMRRCAFPCSSALLHVYSRQRV